jgi:serine/threonine protein kinase
MNISEIFHNRYELIQRVGTGGFSEVWKAHDMRSGMEVAIKIFRKQDDEGISLCKEEYLKAFEMSHPYIMTPFHFDVDHDRPYLVMKYLTGGTLAAKEGQLSKEEVRRLITQLSSALQYLHFKTNPIIHGDLKPDNILIDDMGNFYLTDFGISTRLQEKFTETMLMSSQSSLGKGVTPMAYRSPEHFKYKNWSQPQLTNKADIWSAAVTIYHTLYQQLPFNGEGGLGQLIMMRSGNHVIEEVLDFPEIIEYDEFIPLLTACLELDPMDRPSILNTEILPKPKSEIGDKKVLVASPFTPGIQKTENKKESNKYIYLLLLFFVLTSIAIAFTFKKDGTLTSIDQIPAKTNAQEMIEISDDTLTHMGLVDPINRTNKEQFSSTVKTEPYSDNVKGQSNLTNEEIATNNKNIKQNTINTNPNLSVNSTLIPEEKTTFNPDANKPVVEEKKPEMPEIKEPNKTGKTAVIKPNISIPLMLNEQINNTENYKSGSKISFIVNEDVISYGDIIIRKGTEVFAEIKRKSDKKLSIRFPNVYTSGGTKLKGLNLDNFEINIESDRKGKVFRPVTSSYQKNVLIN